MSTSPFPTGKKREGFRQKNVTLVSFRHCTHGGSKETREFYVAAAKTFWVKRGVVEPSLFYKMPLFKLLKERLISVKLLETLKGYRV